MTLLFSDKESSALLFIEKESNDFVVQGKSPVTLFSKEESNEFVVEEGKLQWPCSGRKCPDCDLAV